MRTINQSIGDSEDEADWSGIFFSVLVAAILFMFIWCIYYIFTVFSFIVASETLVSNVYHAINNLVGYHNINLEYLIDIVRSYLTNLIRSQSS